MLDLDAYFARIGLTLEERTPTLATLNAIIHAHVQTIPFENLDVLRGRPIELDLAAIEAKLVQGKRGGYCFEQNSFLLQVLTQLGFEGELLSARVRYQRPHDYTPPRTHVFVRLEIDGVSWLADVGVGAISPTAALCLQTEEAQTTPHDVRRVTLKDERYHHQVRFGSEWHDVCEFTLERSEPIDREVGNWFTSTHPQSIFRNRLIASRVHANGGRLSLVNREFTQRAKDGQATTRTLRTRAELFAVLSEHFGIELALDDELRVPD